LSQFDAEVKPAALVRACAHVRKDIGCGARVLLGAQYLGATDAKLAFAFAFNFGPRRALGVDAGFGLATAGVDVA